MAAYYGWPGTNQSGQRERETRVYARWDNGQRIALLRVEQAEGGPRDVAAIARVEAAFYSATGVPRGWESLQSERKRLKQNGATLQSLEDGESRNNDEQDNHESDQAEDTVSGRRYRMNGDCPRWDDQQRAVLLRAWQAEGTPPFNAASQARIVAGFHRATGIHRSYIALRLMSISLRKKGIGLRSIENDGDHDDDEKDSHKSGNFEDAFADMIDLDSKQARPKQTRQLEQRQPRTKPTTDPSTGNQVRRNAIAFLRFDENVPQQHDAICSPSTSSSAEDASNALQTEAYPDISPTFPVYPDITFEQHLRQHTTVPTCFVPEIDLMMSDREAADDLRAAGYTEPFTAVKIINEITGDVEETVTYYLPRTTTWQNLQGALQEMTIGWQAEVNGYAWGYSSEDGEWLLQVSKRDAFLKSVICEVIRLSTRQFPGGTLDHLYRLIHDPTKEGLFWHEKQMKISQKFAKAHQERIRLAKEEMGDEPLNEDGTHMFDPYDHDFMFSNAGSDLAIYGELIEESLQSLNGTLKSDKPRRRVDSK